MKRPRPDAGDRLAHALRAAFAKRGVAPGIEETTSQDWTSITFSGARHRLRLRFGGEGAGAAADALIAGIELDLRGHVLVDLAILSDERDEAGTLARLEIEALTVETL